MSYLDNLALYNNKAESVIGALGVEIRLLTDKGQDATQLQNTVIWYNQLLTGANDTTLSDATRLILLTYLVDSARLNQVPLVDISALIQPIAESPSYTGFHNDLSGIEGNGFIHLSLAERNLIYSAITTVTWSIIEGAISGSATLTAALDAKENLITSGDSNAFWDGTKVFRRVTWADLTGAPNTLAGFGILSTDSLFDTKYIQFGTLLAGLNTTTPTAITTSDSVIVAFGNLQAQISQTVGTPGTYTYPSSVTVDARGRVSAITSGSGAGAVNTIGIAVGNGFTGTTGGTASDPRLTIALNSLTGMLKGGGSTISVATAGTDYVIPAALASYLPLAGGTMTGNILLSGTARLDRSTASTLDIGTTSANLINIGKTASISSAGTTINLGTVNAGIWHGEPVPLLYGGTGMAFTDPNANVLLGWNDLNGEVSWITLGTGLSFDDSTSTLSATITGFVNSISGTADRITITGTSAIPIVNIASTYVGQASIITVGTIGSGTWQGATIGFGFGGTGLSTLGTPGQVLKVNSVGTAIEWGTGGSGGSPGGTTTEFQYRAGSTTFGGAATLIYDTGSSSTFTTTGSFYIVDDVVSRTSGVLFDVSLTTDVQSWYFPDTTLFGGDTFVGAIVAQELQNKTLGTGTVVALGSDATGDIYYRAATTGLLTRLGIGSTGDVLKVAAGLPSWGAAPTSMVYPGAGIANSTGTAWGVSYTTTGTGTVLALATSPTLVTPVLGVATGTSVDVTGALTSGVASTTAGTLVLRNASTAFTQTFRGTNPAASIIYDLPTTAPTAGQILSASAPSAGVSTLSWSTPGAASSLAFNLLTAAANTNAIDNTSFAQEWRWNSLVGATGLKLSSTSTAGTTGQTLFGVALSGINATSSVTTYAATIANTHTGIGSVNYALSLSASGGATGLSAYGLSIATTGPATTNYGISVSASGGTTNYAIDVIAGISRFAGGTAAIPQLILTPSAITTPTNATNGALWYDTTASNSSLILYKDSANTKIITQARNPDFATGTASGVVVADLNGTLTKSADLTALGVYSAYANVTNNTTTITSLISGSIAGSTTLPANFFALGKTMRVLLVGTITCDNLDDSTITLSIGATAQTLSVTNLPSCSGDGFVMELFFVCRVAGASASVSVTGSFTIANSNPQNTHVFVFPTVAIGTFNSAVSQVFNIQNTWTQDSPSEVVVQTNTAYYLN
jgi:hypothetical protein